MFLLAVEEYYGIITSGIGNDMCYDNKSDPLYTFEKKSKRVPSNKSNKNILRVLRTVVNS